MSSEEDENYVWVGVNINPWQHQYSIDCCEAMVATVDADGNPGPSLHVGDFDTDSLLVLADAAISELISAGVRAGLPEDVMRLELIGIAVRCGFSEEEEQDALYYDPGARREIRDMAEELGVDADV